MERFVSGNCEVCKTESVYVLMPDNYVEAVRKEKFIPHIRTVLADMFFPALTSSK